MFPTYLAGSLILFFVWIILFLHRSDTRCEMIFMSCLVALLGVFMETFFWTRDWWRPVTITRTLIGPEDILFGFSMGGIATVIYEELFKKQHAERRSKNAHHHHTRELSLLLLLGLVFGSVLYFAFGLNSADIWIISVTASALVIWFLRRDLILPSIMTGIILTTLAFLSFFIMDLIEPGFVFRWWLLNRLSGILVLGVPLEDVMWFFTTGLFIGPIYEFWQGTRLRKLKGMKSI